MLTRTGRMNNGQHSHGNYRQNLPQHQHIGYQDPQGRRGWGQQHPQPQAQQHLHNGNQQALPPGWVEATDPNSGKVYYCNPKTRETKWERPSVCMINKNMVASPNGVATSGDRASHLRATQKGQQQQQVQPPLPPGWVEATDPSSGKVYYCNPRTRETKWERPIPTTFAVSSTFLENEGSTTDPHGKNSSGSKFQKAGEGSGKDIEEDVAQSILDQSIPSSAIETTMGVNKIGHNSCKQVDNDHFDELRSLTTGQIAHLIRLQQRQQNAEKLSLSDEERKVQLSTIVSNPNESNKGSSDPTNYVPIHLSLMSSLSSMERTEPGRLDVRMHALREELKKFGYNQTSAQPTHLR